MAHELDESNGRWSMFAVGTPPWHGLGTVVKDAVSSQEAIRLAGLDWAVEKWPLQALGVGLDGVGTIDVPGKVATVRSDTKGVLGVVGTDYEVFQNNVAFDFVDSLVEAGEVQYETAGAIRKGRRVWMLARIPRSLYVADTEDEVRPYVLLTNTHDGSSALRMLPTSVRVVCANTLNLALREGARDGLAIVHRGSLTDRITQARRNLLRIGERIDEFQHEIDDLAARELSIEDTAGYFESLIPTGSSEKFGRKLLEAWAGNLDNPRQALPGMERSAWAAFNAVSEWADHGRSVRGGNDFERRDNRLNSVWFGSSADFKTRAYERALALVR